MSWNFDDELKRFGPESAPPADVASAQRYCEYVTKTHYENFTVASWLLPRRLRPHFHAVYAWCRWADDLADETGDGTELLNWWQEELDRCYAGDPRHPVTVALRNTINSFPIPKTLFTDLLSAFLQDQTVKQYQTFNQLLDYCRRSANPVGRIVLHLFECFSEENGRLSDFICTALQLANFWQDVARDFAIGRIYLPREDLTRFGYAEKDFENRRCNDAFRELLRFELNRTRELFRQGEPLLGKLPKRARIDVTLFLRGGLAVLHAIENQGCDVWTTRPEVSKAKKARLLFQALLS